MVDTCALMDIRTSQAMDRSRRHHTLQFTHMSHRSQLVALWKTLRKWCPVFHSLPSPLPPSHFENKIWPNLVLAKVRTARPGEKVPEGPEEGEEGSLGEGRVPGEGGGSRGVRGGGSGSRGSRAGGQIGPELA